MLNFGKRSLRADPARKRNRADSKESGRATPTFWSMSDRKGSSGAVIVIDRSDWKRAPAKDSRKITFTVMGDRMESRDSAGGWGSTTGYKLGGKVSTVRSDKATTKRVVAAPDVIIRGDSRVNVPRDSHPDAFGWILHRVSQMGPGGARAAADAWADALAHHRRDRAIAAIVRLPALIVDADDRTATRLGALAASTIATLKKDELDQVGEALVNTAMANPARGKVVASTIRAQRTRLRRSKAWPLLQEIMHS